MYKKILCVIMGRAGSHAISQWIRAQYPQECNAQFKSNCAIFRNPIVSTFLEDDSDNYVVYRQENLDFARVGQMVNDHPDKLNEKIIVYSLRDPWNHFASLLQFWIVQKSGVGAKIGKDWTKEKFVAYIKKHYVRNHIEMMSQALQLKETIPKKSVFINYNKWFVDKEYRREISDSLKLPTSENGIQIVWNSSSFMQKVNVAQELNVFDRWKEYIDWEEYREIFQNKELITMSKQIFVPPFEVDDSKNALYERINNGLEYNGS